MNIIHYITDKWDRAHEEEANRSPSLIPLRRECDRTVYSWQCAHCGECWKVYQGSSHHPDCGPHLIDLRKLRKGRRVVHAEHGVGTIVSMRRDKKKNGLQDGYVKVRFDRRSKPRTYPLRGGFRVIPPALLARIRPGPAAAPV